MHFLKKSIPLDKQKEIFYNLVADGTFLRKPKLSRHIKLNHTNISLLLQEAIQKYRKLTDY